jgi:hypothetical protein
VSQENADQKRKMPLISASWGRNRPMKPIGFHAVVPGFSAGNSIYGE